jgi:hypothetical protein
MILWGKSPYLKCFLSKHIFKLQIRVLFCNCYFSRYISRFDDPTVENEELNDVKLLLKNKHDPTVKEGENVVLRRQLLENENKIYNLIFQESNRK